MSCLARVRLVAALAKRVEPGSGEDAPRTNRVGAAARESSNPGSVSQSRRSSSLVSWPSPS
eukprot:1288772-Prymnesium_polylepis.1